MTKILESLNISSVLYSVFVSFKQIQEVLIDHKETNLGLSIIVTGAYKKWINAIGKTGCCTANLNNWRRAHKDPRFINRRQVPDVA